MLIEAHQDKTFRSVVNNANIATPDGMPLAKSLGVLYGKSQDRVAGMDLFPSLLKESEERELSVFLYGSTEEVLTKIIERIKKDHPGLKIAGYYSPPFRVLTEIEKKEIIDLINGSGPDFVMVALGCPKQEKWMAEHKNKINSCMLGVGGAFPVYAGVQDRAPQWVQNISMEWAYRLIQEPKRLWKRYVITNSLFILLMAGFSARHVVRVYNVKRRMK
jgi:N-acetylglucosaminyldiphosphoundecaprenol N-acetyl-beta-D-mannosaminyltransferase